MCPLLRYSVDFIIIKNHNPKKIDFIVLSMYTIGIKKLFV